MNSTDDVMIRRFSKVRVGVMCTIVHSKGFHVISHMNHTGAVLSTADQNNMKVFATGCTVTCLK